MVCLEHQILNLGKALDPQHLLIWECFKVRPPSIDLLVPLELAGLRLGSRRF